jgi:N utilization substance protein B
MRKARQLALEALYESETSEHPPLDVYERHLAGIADEARAPSRQRAREYGRELLRGVVERRDEIDGHIQRAATQYPVDTLAIVDRNILRLAIWELLADPAAPVAAVVNEAVELAHRYGGESAPAFVNGVLRTVSERITAARAASSEP